MKIHTVIILVAISICATACAKYAKPNFLYGKYYMTGDDNCRYVRQLSENRIMCQNASRKDVGYREAMTDQQLLMYMHQQSIDQANSAITLQYLQGTKPVNCTSNAIGS